MQQTKRSIDPKRLGLYKKIEIGRNQLPEMDDDEYFRDWLESNYKARSRTKLSNAQLARVVDMFSEMGAVFTSGGTAKKRKPHARPDWIEIPEGVCHAQEKRAICAIWKKLGYSMTSLNTRVEREFKAPNLLWLHDIDKLARLLSDLQKREKAFDKKQAVSEGES